MSKSSFLSSHFIQTSSNSSSSSYSCSSSFHSLSLSLSSSHPVLQLWLTEARILLSSFFSVPTLRSRLTTLLSSHFHSVTETQTSFPFLHSFAISSFRSPFLCFAYSHIDYSFWGTLFFPFFAWINVKITPSMFLVIIKISKYRVYTVQNITIINKDTRRQESKVKSQKRVKTRKSESRTAKVTKHKWYSYCSKKGLLNILFWSFFRCFTSCNHNHFFPHVIICMCPHLIYPKR